MKTKKLLMAVFSLFILATCSEQETDSVEITDSFSIAKKNWQTKALSNSFFENQSQISHYSFSKKDILSVLYDPNIIAIRFEIGLQNDQIIMNLVGVNYYGEEIMSVNSTVNKNKNFYEKDINQLKNNTNEYPRTKKNDPIISKHLLEYYATFDYLEKWQEALTSKNIKEFIMDEDIRFKYYSLEREVVTSMISKDNTESIALFLGVNTKNKLTTVFLKKDQKNLLILNTNQRDEDGYALDFTEPCPNFCDPPVKCYCGGWTWAPECCENNEN